MIVYIVTKFCPDWLIFVDAQVEFKNHIQGQITQVFQVWLEP